MAAMLTTDSSTSNIRLKGANTVSVTGYRRSTMGVPMDGLIIGLSGVAMISAAEPDSAALVTVPTPMKAAAHSTRISVLGLRRATNGISSALTTKHNAQLSSPVMVVVSASSSTAWTGLSGLGRRASRSNSQKPGRDMTQA